jgi:hypothetical protein
MAVTRNGIPDSATFDFFFSMTDASASHPGSNTTNRVGCTVHIRTVIAFRIQESYAGQLLAPWPDGCRDARNGARPDPKGHHRCR